jgi:hypothetical protein
MSFSKTESRKVKQVPSGGQDQWEEEDIRKGCRRMNVWKYYVLVDENGKTIPGMGGRDKGELWRR